VQASSIFTATDSLAQAYAYPYEGFALGVAEVASTTTTDANQSTTTPATPTPTTPTSSPSAVSSTATAFPASSPTPLSSGTIAGIVIGSVGCVLLAASLLLLFLRYRQHHSHGTSHSRTRNELPASPSSVAPSGNNGYLKSADWARPPPILDQLTEMPHEQMLRWHELDAAERKGETGKT
jgi:hypothetical protein